MRVVGWVEPAPNGRGSRSSLLPANSDQAHPDEKGRMLIWPSHVPHAVEQGTADESEERIVVAFNIMIRGRIQLFTASLDLS
jgi:hypothetical protein